MTTQRRLPFCAAVLTLATIVSLLPCPTAMAQESITVVALSGRTFTGVVDDRTDDDRLWLRYGSERTTILRPIAWDHIKSAQLNGEDIDRDQLRSTADSIKSVEPQRVFFQYKDASADGANDDESQPATSSSRTMSSRAQHSLGSSTRVQSVQFDAFLANWDSDVETDGLVVSVRPILSDGRPAQVYGTLQVELLAFHGQTSQRARQNLRQPYTSIAHWTKPIAFSERGEIKVQLPFQNSHPEFDTNISPYGLVNLKLVVPGHGIYERSIDGVRIRPYSPFRDALERSGHDRFLPGEYTSHR